MTDTHRPIFHDGPTRAEISCSCGDAASAGDDEFVAHIQGLCHRETLEALDRIKSQIEYRLTVGLRHVPGATESEERHYNDGQAFGLRYALDLLLLASHPTSSLLASHPTTSPEAER